MIQRILVIQQKMIGDVLISSVLCDLLKRRMPECKVDYLVNEETVEVVRGHPQIDKLHIFKRQNRKSAIHFYRFLKEIRSVKYDVVIDAYGKLESNIISLFSNARMRISYKKWYTEWIYTHRCHQSTVRKTTMGLAIENRLLLLEPLLGSSAAFYVEPKIHLSQKEIHRAEERLKSGGIDSSRPLVMIGILGSSDIKSYPLNYFLDLLSIIILEIKPCILLNYSPHQFDQVKAYLNTCPERIRSSIYENLEPGNLRSFLAALSLCDAYVGNEGGMVNMAKALGIPTFSIFSPWITKNAWNTFNDDPRNQAVHLSDFYPALFEGKSKSELKNNSLALYSEFKPELIEKQLLNFLKTEGISH